MITSGSVVNSADLNAAFSPYLDFISQEAQREPGVQIKYFFFDDVVFTSTAAKLTASFVPSDDQELVQFGVYSYDSNTNAGVSATLSGQLTSGSLTVSGSHSAANLSLRYNPRNPDHTLLKGATYTISVHSSRTSGTGSMDAFVMVRNKLRRTVI